MPDATGLELIAQRVGEAVGEDAVAGTVLYRDQATLDVAPGSVRDVLQYLRDRDPDPWPALMSLHGVDYLPPSRGSASTISSCRWSASTG